MSWSDVKLIPGKKDKPVVKRNNIVLWHASFLCAWLRTNSEKNYGYVMVQ